MPKARGQLLKEFLDDYGDPNKINTQTEFQKKNNLADVIDDIYSKAAVVRNEYVAVNQGGKRNADGELVGLNELLTAWKNYISVMRSLGAPEQVTGAAGNHIKDGSNLSTKYWNDKEECSREECAKISIVNPGDPMDETSDRPRGDTPQDRAPKSMKTESSHAAGDSTAQFANMSDMTDSGPAKDASNSPTTDTPIGASNRNKASHADPTAPANGIPDSLVAPNNTSIGQFEVDDNGGMRFRSPFPPMPIPPNVVVASGHADIHYWKPVPCGFHVAQLKGCVSRDANGKQGKWVYYDLVARSSVLKNKQDFFDNFKKPENEFLPGKYDSLPDTFYDLSIFGVARVLKGNPDPDLYYDPQKCFLGVYVDKKVVWYTTEELSSRYGGLTISAFYRQHWEVFCKYAIPTKQEDALVDALTKTERSKPKTTALSSAGRDAESLPRQESNVQPAPPDNRPTKDEELIASISDSSIEDLVKVAQMISLTLAAKQKEGQMQKEAQT